MKNTKIVFITIAIIIAAILLGIFALQGVQNKAISLEEQIHTAYSDIDVQQKRRADLVPNLVDCVKAMVQSLIPPCIIKAQLKRRLKLTQMIVEF